MEKTKNHNDNQGKQKQINEYLGDNENVLQF